MGSEQPVSNKTKTQAAPGSRHTQVPTVCYPGYSHNREHNAHLNAETATAIRWGQSAVGVVENDAYRCHEPRKFRELCPLFSHSIRCKQRLWLLRAQWGYQQRRRLHRPLSSKCLKGRTDRCHKRHRSAQAQFQPAVRRLARTSIASKPLPSNNIGAGTGTGATLTPRNSNPV